MLTDEHYKIFTGAAIKLKFNTKLFTKGIEIIYSGMNTETNFCLTHWIPNSSGGSTAVPYYFNANQEVIRFGANHISVVEVTQNYIILRPLVEDA